jgi:hypothetical protein
MEKKHAKYCLQESLVKKNYGTTKLELELAATVDRILSLEGHLLKPEMENSPTYKRFHDKEKNSLTMSCVGSRHIYM